MAVEPPHIRVFISRNASLRMPKAQPFRKPELEMHTACVVVTTIMFLAGGVASTKA